MKPTLNIHFTYLVPLTWLGYRAIIAKGGVLEILTDSSSKTHLMFMYVVLEGNDSFGNSK